MKVRELEHYIGKIHQVILQKKKDINGFKVSQWMIGIIHTYGIWAILQCLEVQLQIYGWEQVNIFKLSNDIVSKLGGIKLDLFIFLQYM